MVKPGRERETVRNTQMRIGKREKLRQPVVETNQKDRDERKSCMRGRETDEDRKGTEVETACRGDVSKGQRGAQEGERRGKKG